MAMAVAMPSFAKHPKVPREKDMSAYLMVYHKDADHGLHMAVSYDGYTFKAVNADRPVIGGDTIAMQHGIRDPHIFRGPDGGFYMAMTDLNIFGKRDGFRTTEWERDGKKYGWGNNRGLVLMKSFDLCHWTRANIDFTRLPGFGELGCVWAPEIVFDAKTQQIMVHFTTRFGTEKDMIYYVYVNDDFNALTSEPKPLFSAPDHKYAVIDSDIIEHDGVFHLFYVSHESTATIKHATSKSITGPYVMDNNYYDGERLGHEAPNCWKRHGEQRWVVMHDNYRIKPNNFGFTETTDFVHYTPIGRFDEGVMKREGFAEQKHGSVIPITKKEAKRLLKARF